MTAVGAVSRQARIGRWLCVAGAVIGALGLIGSVAETAPLSAIIPSEAAMTANTSLGLLLIGAAGALRAREDMGRASWNLTVVAALVALAIGLGTIAEYAAGIDLHIDRMIGHAQGPTSHPGRPAPATAVALTLLAAALLVFDSAARAQARPADWLIMPAGFIALTALLGFVFGLELRHRILRAPLIGTALPTAIGLLLIATGLLFERPSTGLMGLATSGGPGGRQLRRFALPAVLVPVLLGFIAAFPLRSLGDQALAVLVAVLAAAMTIGAFLVLALTAASLNRTYDALESSREWSRSLVEQAPDGVFVADLTGRYTEVNDAGCRILGYAREEILDKKIVDLVASDEIERLAQSKEKMLRGQADVGEWSLRRKDGRYIAAEVSAKILPDGRWQGMVRDVSERKRLEHRLRAAEAEQKFLAEFGTALAATIDDRETLQVVARWVVSRVADCCSVETLNENGTLNGWTVMHRDPAKAELCHRIQTAAFNPSLPFIGSTVRATRKPLLISDITPALIPDTSQNAELTRLMRELDPRSCIAVPLLAQGSVVGALTFLSTTPGRPYTEREIPFAEAVATRAALAVENARLYRTAQDAIRLREDVLSVVAHDLRNPLATIMLQVTALRRILEQVQRPTQPAQAIERATTRMNHLIQALLDVARAEGGRLPIETRPLSVSPFVVEMVHAQESLAASAKLDLRLESAAHLPEIQADRERLTQVFENLIGNAIKFTGPGGRIIVGAEARDGEVLFRVADTGIGIADDDLPHVFERLWQGKDAGRHGAGLGLPIVKGIIEAHGGRVWVESTPGEGSTFFFTVPTAAGTATSQPEPAAREA